ncbi:MAG: thiamine phosphate synthase [Alphaproteobacteria bacterium]|nr:MAG: thiamine phosphate synthase [Alphaproteobacteria bacterium]
MTGERCRVYLLTPPRIDLAEFAGRLDAAFSGGDIACVQLRLKGAGDEEVLAAAERLMPIAHARGAAFLVNDRPDLAAVVGADGVHLGPEDASVAEARRLLGHDKDIGVSCRASRHAAFEAGEAGADYVAFGAFFPTTTKAETARADPEILRWWSEIAELPSVAIGGITAENCAPLVAAGADFLAVSSYVWDHPEGPAAAIRALNEAIDRADPDRAAQS